jgi:hypothetical protein
VTSQSFKIWSHAAPSIFRSVEQTIHTPDNQDLHQHNVRTYILETPVQAWTGSEGFRMLRFQDMKKISRWRWFHCQPYEPSGFTSHKMLLVLIFVSSRDYPKAKERTEELCQWIFPLTPPGIEPATFQLVAECLNQLHYPMYSHKHTHTHIYIYIYKANQVFIQGLTNQNFCLSSTYISIFSHYSLLMRIL